VVEGQPPRPLDGPLVAPLSRSLSWPTAHRMTQSPQGGNGGDMVAKIRGSATISRGTRMVKILSGKQLAGYPHGWLPQGFCYREFDIAHLRTPAELAILRSDGDEGGPEPAVFACAGVRWTRYGVEALARHTPYVRWCDAPCTVVRDEGEWLRVRLIRPSGDLVARVRANAVERGVYEAWAPRAEALGYREVDVWYEGISHPSEPALRPQWTDRAS